MILVAEDHADSLEYVTFLLKKRGYAVVGVQDGRQALDLARQNPPRVFILDESMPGLTGLQVFEQIQSDPLLKESKVIFLSALFDNKLVKRALDMGAVEWLIKGVHGQNHILDAVAKAMSSHC